ncbi:MAG: 4-hydroxy-3-methylbut-2-enyl diphosphate reductase [Candidatus Omnitrophica bacterium]|nr:4-hydroxy-3-methylbut-2-enyl diphosphate reductase [Candidatus Omnitrophota bacterium]
MKISLAKSAGFCFGVKRAIDMALKTSLSHKNVYVLGDIVHNEDVVREIEKTGIKKAKRLSSGKNKVFLIRAHGTSRQVIEKAKGLGYDIIDATCPMVKEIHRIVEEMDNRGRKIIVIGDKKHDEVRGIIGHAKQKAMVIDDKKNIPLAAIKKFKKACVVVQSTQNTEKVQEIVAILKKYIAELEFFNTICNPTRQRQEEVKKMPGQNDVMIIIGSKNSANTKRLYQISKSLNKKSHWVSQKEDIKAVWFKNAHSIGVTAGASTPESTTEKIISYIQALTSLTR